MSAIVRNRKSKKNKTTAFYEIKYNDSAKNIEMTRSINIVGLKTANRISSSSIKKRGDTETQIVKVSKRRPKLSLNIAPGAILPLVEDIKKEVIPSIHETYSKTKIDIEQIIENLQKTNFLLVENNEVFTDLDCFKQLCQNFFTRIQDLENLNFDLSTSVRKYERHFEEVSLKEEYALKDFDQFYEGSKKDCKFNRNYQLKILNLERKIETLNYIIRNYRLGNKEEIKNFQKKVNDFKPTLQSELTNLLCQANRKNKQLQSVIDYLKKSGGLAEMKNSTGSINATTKIIIDLQAKDNLISELEYKIMKQKQKNTEFQKKQKELQSMIEENKNLKGYIEQLKSDKGILKKDFQICLQEKQNSEKEYFQVLQQLQEMSYKVKGLQRLEPQINEKQEQIIKNSIIITRLQNEVSCLKSKLHLAIKKDQNQLFNRDTGSIEIIESHINSVNDLSERFGEELDKYFAGDQERYFFMSHLYERTKEAFQKIVSEYRDHMQSIQIENKELKIRLNSMIHTAKRKAEINKQIASQIENIEDKRKRSLMAQANIHRLSQCTGCNSWLLNSGQLHNLCEQMQKLTKKFIEE